MTEKLDYISVDKYFWIQFNENFISFGLDGLPNDIHLTVSYNNDKPDINFHLTKNTEDKNNKPKIEIFRINKELLEQTLKERYFTLLSNIVEPVDITTLTDGTTLEYISTKEIEEKSEKTIFNSFTDKDYKLKKRRLKIKTDIEKKFNEISSNLTLQELYKTMRKPLDSSTEPLESGIIVTSTDSISAIKILGSWYKFRDKVELSDLFKGIIEPMTITRLRRRFKESIIRLKTAKTFADTETENKKSIVLQRPAANNMQMVLQTQPADLPQIFELFEQSIHYQEKKVIRFGEIMTRMQLLKTLKLATNIK